MILVDRDLRQAMTSRRLIITPPPLSESISTSSIDLRVGHSFSKWRKEAPGVALNINCSEVRFPDLAHYAESVPVDERGFVTIFPKDMLLGLTLETVQFPPAGKLAGRVEGRSSLARLGLTVHMTAPTIHSGFSGPIVLEFMNHGPHTLKLEADTTPICQLIVEEVTNEPQGTLVTPFQNQTGAFGRQV